MKTLDPTPPDREAPANLLCDLLILSDGTILAHNLTPVMAAVLQVLNPADETLKHRASGSNRREPSDRSGPSRSA